MFFKKSIIIFILLFFISGILTASEIPSLFNIKWGSDINYVQNQILRNNLTALKHYSIFGSSENQEILTSSSVKYYSEGTPFFDIPCKVIFTFYNAGNKKNNLKLAKIEIFFNKKDKNDMWVDSRSIYKDILRDFFETYLTEVEYSKQSKYFFEENYQITFNGIYIHFINNINNSIQDKNVSIYISYESNKYQNLILKKEQEIMTDE